MPADRVTEAAPAPSEQDLRDALIAAVNGHRISPDLAWAIIGRWDRADPPVAVPGPASEPADPVVSPADTIRRARNRIAARGQHDLVGLADLADALLAVGERLTEALRKSRPYVAGYDRTGEVLAQVDAVLAGEEDARPGLPVAVEEAIERHDADRADEALAALCEATREDVQDLEAFSGGVFDCCPVCGKLANEHPPRAAGEGDT